MSILSTSQLVINANGTQPDNTNRLISPVDTRTMDIDIAESSYNKLTDALLVGLSAYSISRAYGVGETMVYDSGSGLSTWISNQATQGVFNAAAWNLVGIGASGSTLQLGPLTNGLILSGSNPQVLELQLSSTSTTGSLSSADWNTFNQKQDLLSFTPEDVLNRGVANGYVPLSASTKIDVSFMPDGIVGAVQYQGTWSPTFNIPSISDATGSQGQYYVVSENGSRDLGSGQISFNTGDWVIHNGSVFQKLDNTNNGVTSVQGLTGPNVALGGGNVGRMTEWGPSNTFAESNVRVDNSGKIGLGVDIGTLTLSLGSTNTGIGYLSAGNFRIINHDIDGNSYISAIRDTSINQTEIQLSGNVKVGQVSAGKAHVSFAATTAVTSHIKLDPSGVNFAPSGTVDDGSLWANGNSLYFRRNGVTVDLLSSNGIVEGSGIELSGNVVNWGGALSQGATILGGNNSIALGALSNRTSTFDIHSSDGIFITNTGSGASGFGGFVECVTGSDSSGFAVMNFQALPTNSGDTGSINFFSGAASAGNYFGFPFQDGNGEIAFSANGVDAKSVTQSFRKGVDEEYRLTMGNIFPTTVEKSFSMFRGSNSFVFSDPLSGKGVKYNDWIVDQANINWATDDDALASIGLIKANVSGGGGVPDGNKGDITVSSSGVVWVINDLAIGTAKIANQAVDNAKLSAMLGDRIKGRSGTTGGAQDLTGAQVNVMLPVFTDTLKGSVPASGGGTTNYLRADGSWGVPSSGATIRTGESSSITGSLNGNTNYTQTITVTGASLDDTCSGSINKAFYDDMVASAQDISVIAAITGADTGEVKFRLDSFLAENTNRKTRIVSF